MTGLAALEQRIAAIEDALGGVPAVNPHDLDGRTVADMVRWAAFQNGLKAAELFGTCRELRYNKARFAVYWCAREARSLSYPIIGRVLGRDHSSVIYGHRQAVTLRDRDPAFRLLTDRMLARFSLPDETA